MNAAIQMSEAERKLRNARAVVVQAHPFFSALLLNQQVVEAPWCETMATDGKRLYFNPEFVLRTPADELQGVCAHEALHPGFCHHLRRGNRNPKRWNEAADLCINPILLDADFKLPADALYREDCRGMNAEAVYAKLEAEEPPPQQPSPQEEADAEEDAENEAREREADFQANGERPEDFDEADESGDGEGEGEQQGQGDEQAEGEGESQPGEGEGAGANAGGQEPTGDVGGCGWLMDGEECKDEAARQDAEQEWKQRMATAAMYAAGDMPGSLEEAVKELLSPRADWRDLLRRYMTALAKTDTSWDRPNRRFIASGLVLPSEYDETIGRVAFLCDVSASMPRGAPQRALSEVAAICQEIRPEAIDAVFFDSGVTKTVTYEVGEEPDVSMVVPGGGGTVFNSAYDWLEEQGHEYSVVIILTDLQPNDAWETHRVPQAPIVWIDYADSKVVPPYGDECIRLPAEDGGR